jgi:hypothetical protein
VQGLWPYVAPLPAYQYELLDNTMLRDLRITLQPISMFTPLVGCKEPYKHTCLLPIPGVIDDYNYYMGRVDIADQLRAKFSTQQQGFKPWRPLFYWLLDTAIINSFRLFEHQQKVNVHLRAAPQMKKFINLRFRC